MESYKTLIFLSALILSNLYLYRMIIMIRDKEEDSTDAGILILFIVSFLWSALYFLS